MPHTPTEAVAELHSVPSGQPLPPVPRHPSVQVCASPQTRPPVTVPHSPSVAQPQTPVASQVLDRQTVPSLHVPVPTGYPHFESAALQAPDRQTVTSAGVHGPSPFG